MAGSSRRYTLAAYAVPFLFLAMSGLARANTIIVNTLEGGSHYGVCTLQDAVAAAETQAPVHGCATGSGDNDTIQFIVGGTIYPSDTLVMNNAAENLTIVGPAPGITINGRFDIELIDVEDSTLTLKDLTLTEGSNEGGGALFSGGATVSIAGCTFNDNEAAEGGAIFAGGSVVVIVNSTFTGNFAEEAGGGIYNDESEVSVTNATFSGNQAPVVAAGAVPTGPPESN